MNLETYIHHFLLYSENPEKTFASIQKNLDLIEAFPVANFGGFYSGMLWLQNSYLEIVIYPKNIPAPNSNDSNVRFVCIALKCNRTADETYEYLTKHNISCSKVLDENVQDKDGNVTTIAKIILLQEYVQDFRIFFVFHTNDFFEQIEKRISHNSSPSFDSFELSLTNPEKIKPLFRSMGIKELAQDTFVTSKKQTIVLKRSASSSSEISRFTISKENTHIDLVGEKYYIDD
ncbi:MAG: hypothetical protein AAF518_26380 [Spirochaetota bacterium]